MTAELHTRHCWSHRFHAGCLCEDGAEKIDEQQYEAGRFSRIPDLFDTFAGPGRYAIRANRGGVAGRPNEQPE